jgi:prefoldin subunit 5
MIEHILYSDVIKYLTSQVEKLEKKNKKLRDEIEELKNKK